MFLHLTRYSWIRHSHSAMMRTMQFTRKPWAGGIVLLICVVLAMLLANMEWSARVYHSLLSTDLKVLITSPNRTIDILFPREMTVEKLVNDGLMTLFFFLVGLEIKREMLNGELSSFRKSILPVMAAIGGMIVPALIYRFVNVGTPAEVGWGVPMATDIAFAIGILSMLGDRVPVSLKIFLTALAIADDLGAILVIAIFYGSSVNFTYLLLALALAAITYVINRLGERHIFFYLITGGVIWALFYYSGVHATMAGVLMAMLIPTRARYSKQFLLRQLDAVESSILNSAQENDGCAEIHYHEQLRKMSQLTRRSIPMSSQLEEVISPYVTFLVMPIFALVNGGVHIDASHLNIFKFSSEVGSVGLGVVLGLVVGKPLGIFLMSFLTIKTGVASMPKGASWIMLLAVATLGGIGFTMSIFVDTLAFSGVSEEFVNIGKIAILFASLVSAAIGASLIVVTSKGEKLLKQQSNGERE